MNEKQERLDYHEGVFKFEPDFIFGQGQTQSTPQNCEFETNTPSQIVYEIKQEMECEEPNVDHDLSPENDPQLCSTFIKKELENTSEVKAYNDIGNINEDISEYVQCKSELLTTHCDLPTLKNENTEYPDCLTESCNMEEDESILNLLKNNPNVSNLKRKYLCPKNSNGDILDFGKLLIKSNSTHLITHTNEKPFKCDTCSKEFNRKCSLKTHLISHTNEKPFKCDICSKEFNRKFILQTHLITHNNEKPFKCHICRKEYTQKSKLQAHLITHTNEKPFKCEVCSKRFTQNFNLQQHLITHTNEKPFKCKICLKKFNYKCSLQTHLLTHTSEKPFKCDVCFKEYNDKSNLRQHFITHNNEKRFKCDICFKEFKHKCSLQTHLITHTNEKPFKCDTCSKEFNRKCILQRHLITHANGNN